MKKTVIALALVLLIAIIGTLIYFFRMQLVDAKQTASELDERFIAMVGSNVDLNRGIGFSSVWINRSFGAQTYPEDMNFVVTNSSKEAVIFPDSGYGVTVYWFDQITDTWKIASMKVTYAKHSVIVPSGTDSYETTLGNSVTIFGSDFVKTDLGEVRIYVAGVGANSGTVYGAYLDVRLGTP